MIGFEGKYRLRSFWAKGENEEKGEGVEQEKKDRCPTGDVENVFYSEVNGFVGTLT